MAVKDVINDWLQSQQGQEAMQGIKALQGEHVATGATDTGGTTTPDPTRMPTRTRKAVDAPDELTTSQQRMADYVQTGKVNNYGELEDLLLQRMEEYTPESDDDRKKRERNEKRLKNLATIADILGAMHKSYSYQRGVQPMELPSLSEKARERFERAKAERDKEFDRYVNYGLTIGKIRDSRDAAEREARRDAQQAKYQDALAKNYEDQHNDRVERMALDRYKVEVNERIAQGKFDLQAELNQIRKDYYDKKISVDQMNARTAEARVAEQRRHNQVMEVPVDDVVTVTEDNGFGGTKTKTTSHNRSRGGGSSGGNKGTGYSSTNSSTSKGRGY